MAERVISKADAAWYARAAANIRTKAVRTGLITPSGEGPTLRKRYPPMTESGDLIRKTPDTDIIVDPETGTQVLVMRYNWDKMRPGVSVGVHFPRYNNRIDAWSTQQALHDELAEQMPDTPFLAIAHPGMGSERLKPDQKEELLGADAYFSIADRQLRAMQTIGIKRFHVIGASMGAFAALAVATRASEHDMIVDKAILIFLPGVEEMTKAQLANAMLGNGKYMAPEAAYPFDPHIAKAERLDLSAFDRMLASLPWIAGFPLHDPKFRYVTAMTQATAQERLQKVLETQHQSQIVLVSATKDKVSPYQTVTEIVESLREQRNPEGTQLYGSDRLSQIVFQDGSHAFLENPRRFTRVVEDIITGSSV